MSALVKFSINNEGTAYVMLDRPGRHRNALNEEMIAELTRLFTEEINHNDAVRRVVMCSAPGHKIFCAGMDVDDLRGDMRSGDFARNERASLRFARMLDAVAACGKPKIAIINKAAIGAGATLAALCDYVLADDEARFAYPEWKLGLKPSVSAPYVVARIGRENAIRHFSSATPFDAREAKAMHLVDETCPVSALSARARQVIESAEQGRLKLHPKLLPEQIAGCAPGHEDMIAVVDNAALLYKDRSDSGRENMIARTAQDFAASRIDPNAIEAITGYHEAARLLADKPGRSIQ